MVEATTIFSCPTACPDKKIARLGTVRGRAPDGFGKCLRRLRCRFGVRNASRNARFRGSLCPYRPRIFSPTYSSIFFRAAGGRVDDERMRLMTLAEGPARLSLFSTAQVVLRPRPRTAACLAVVSHPAVIKAWRICASLAACLAFARRSFLVPRIVRPSHKLRALCSQKSPTLSLVGAQGPAFRRRIAQ